MTNLYNLLKARAMRNQMQTAASDTVSQTLNTLSSRNGTAVPTAQPGLQHRPTVQKPRIPKTPSYAMSPDGIEQLHRFQRSGTGSSRRTGPKTADTASMPPPPGRPSWNGQKSTSDSRILEDESHSLQQPSCPLRIRSTAPAFHTRLDSRRCCLTCRQEMRYLRGLRSDDVHDCTQYNYRIVFCVASLVLSSCVLEVPIHLADLILLLSL